MAVDCDGQRVYVEGHPYWNGAAVGPVLKSCAEQSSRSNRNSNNGGAASAANRDLTVSRGVGGPSHVLCHRSLSSWMGRLGHCCTRLLHTSESIRTHHSSFSTHVLVVAVILFGKMGLDCGGGGDG
jgi:hypothetical protein